MRGAGGKVRTQAALDRVGIAPQDHRIDEPVATAVGELSLGKALAQPAVAVVRQRHVARQFLAPERPRLRRIGLKRYLLLHREPLRWPKDRGGLGRMRRCHVIWDSATRLGSAQRQHLRSSAATTTGNSPADADLLMPSR